MANEWDVVSSAPASAQDPWAVVSSAPAQKKIAPKPDESVSKYARVAGRAASPYALATGTGAALGSIVPGVGTALGAGAGAAALGLTDLTATGINALSGLFGGPRIPTGSEAIMDLFPQSFAPETEGQRFLQGTVQGATAGGALGAGSRALASKFAPAAIEGTTTGRVVNALAAKPGAQAVAGGASGAGVAAAQEAGIQDPVALTLIGMGSGVVPFAATALPKVVGRGIYNVTEPFLPGGKEAIKARGYMKALNDNPQLAEYASNLIAQGYTPEQVAVALEQAPGFASLLATSRDASPPIRGQYIAREREQFQPRVNQLAAGSQQATEQALATQNALAQQTATLAEQQASALAQQRQAQAQALMAARAAQRGQAATSRGAQQGRVSTAQQQQTNAISAAQAEAESRAAALAAQAEQQQAAIAAQQQGIAGAVPERSQLEVGQVVTAAREQAITDLKPKVSAQYEKAFELAPESQKFSFADVEAAATKIANDPATALNPSHAPYTYDALQMYGTKTPANPNVSSSGRLLPEWQRTANIPAPKPAMVSLRDASKFIQAINKDLAAIEGMEDAASNMTRANLNKLKQAAQASIESGVSAEAKAAYNAAAEMHRTQIVEPFRQGWVANLGRKGATGVQIQAPESVVSKILSGEDEATRFVRALGTDETAMSAVRSGILDAYRNEVIRNGVIRPAAHDAFMSNAKYGRALKALDDAGMDIRSELSAFGEKSRALLDRNGAVIKGTRQQVNAIEKEFAARQQQIRQQTKDAIAAAKETGAAERSAASERAATARADISARGIEARSGISKQFAEQIAQAESTYKPRVEELRSMAAEAEKQLTKLNQMGIRPEQSEVNLARLSANNPDLRQVIAETRQMLETEADFRRISGSGKQSGGGASELATESAGGTPAMPWIKGLQSSLINFVFARLAGKVDTQLAAEIATEALNSSRFSQILADAAKNAKGSGIGKMLRKPLSKPNLKLLGVSSASSQSNALAPPSQNALAEP